MSIIVPPRASEGHTKWFIYDAKGFFQGREHSEDAAKRATQALADETGERAYAQRHYHESDCAFVLDPQ